MGTSRRVRYDLDRRDLAVRQPGLRTDLPRLSAGGVQGQFWSVYVPSTLPGPEAVVATLEQIDFVHRITARYDDLALVTTADQVESAIANGRLASLIGIEGGHSLRDAVGIAHIGISGDFDRNDFVTPGLEDLASYPCLFDALRTRKWSSADVDAVAGRNILRMMRDVESVACGPR